jgi:E3 ubiquitin-protein ligase DOA10
MDANPTPDPTPFFSDFKNAKKYIIFFSYNLPVGTFSLKKLIFLLNFCVKILLCKYYFSLLNTFMRKGKDPEPEPDPSL